MIDILAGTAIARVHHVAYLTDDLEAAKAFYRTVFGAEVTLETGNPGSGSRMAFLKLGATGVEVIEPADASRLQGRSGLVLDHIGYVVDDLDAAVADLSARGVGFATPEPRVSPEGTRLIYLDTAHTLGTRIHLSERPAEPAGATGDRGPVPIPVS